VHHIGHWQGVVRSTFAYFFNNAGIVSVGEVHDLSPNDWQRVIDVNLMGVMNRIHAVYPRMIAQGSGYIVNTGSSASLVAVSHQPCPAHTDLDRTLRQMRTSRQQTT
jgi:NADP-dependent 3-hydroxy acid dehydrogenase YdfG